MNPGIHYDFKFLPGYRPLKLYLYRKKNFLPLFYFLFFIFHWLLLLKKSWGRYSVAQIYFTSGKQSTEVPELGAWSSSLSMCTVERVISRGDFSPGHLPL